MTRGRPPVTTDPVRAASVLAEGGVVALPTETVYGLAARADLDRAVERIYRVKGRPTGHPLIVHLASADHLGNWAAEIGHAASTLAALSWPGPITLVLRAAEHVSRTVTGGLPTVGLRVPAHELTLHVLERLGTGVAAPSANRFGRVSPTTAQHVVDDLGGDVDLVLDGGPCAVGIESTIVDCTVDPPQVLRPGAIAVEDVERLLGGPVAAASGPSRAPGMLAAHYAPVCRVHLADTSDEATRLVADLRATGRRSRVLDPGDDLVIAARTLYASLRAADEEHVDDLVAVLPPATGLGHAVRDRLRRAATGSGSR